MSVAPPSDPAAAAALQGRLSGQPRPAEPVLVCQAHKFGGTSLATADRFRNVATLLNDYGFSRVVVVSAMQGVTDALSGLANAALAKKPWEEEFRDLRDRHLSTARELDASETYALAAWLEQEFLALHAALSAPSRKPEWFATIQGLGEVWSSRMLKATLDCDVFKWGVMDAREVLEVHAGELGVGVDWTASRSKLAMWRAANPQTNVIVTGFIARDGGGAVTTLGRNGSDYSAAIFAVLFDATLLTIWTDVDGVLSADPRLVPDAVCLESMSYAEACELAYFGAKVLHPQTMAPAMNAGLPIRIRNTLNPDSPGTLITEQSVPAASPVKGLSLVPDMALLELTGAGLIGVPGTAERMFAALHTASVSVTMISQGSSEHSICCVLRADQAERGRMAVQAAFRDAIADGLVEGVRITSGVAVLAAVGDGMVGTPGVSARLFAGLAQARVNIRAIAQGASERNVSVAIDADDATRGLRAAHSAFWLSPQTLSVGIIGPGNVGRALLAQLAQAATRYSGLGVSGLDLRLRAIANSQRMHLAPRRLDPAEAVEALELGQPLDFDRFAAHVRAEHLPHAMIVDCSGSDAVAAHYEAWLAAGIHVVTPNKHAGSGPLERYRAIQAATRNGGHFRYEATVGAGLPVIQTLRSQLDTGDELTEVEGVFSGTLAWLFNKYDGSVPFSQLVSEARALGYTEPDPRDDLSGIDVARKLVILAREAGRELSMEDVAIESLVPPELRAINREEFLARLSELDAPLQVRLDAARREGRALRYLARLDRDGNARVGLVSPEPQHPALHSQLTDNLIQFRTRRYASNPLVVQGPGAGPDVTAAGVFGDILAIAQALGARP
ncbi:bifunctional aspartate kinase/homoserine dehydrogenase I [Lysobacter tyrosinilyticus]